MSEENEGLVSNYSKLHKQSPSVGRVLSSSPRINIAPGGELFTESSSIHHEEHSLRMESVFQIATQDVEHKNILVVSTSTSVEEGGVALGLVVAAGSVENSIGASISFNELDSSSINNSSDSDSDHRNNADTDPCRHLVYSPSVSESISADGSPVEPAVNSSNESESGVGSGSFFDIHNRQTSDENGFDHSMSTDDDNGVREYQQNTSSIEGSPGSVIYPELNTENSTATIATSPALLLSEHQQSHDEEPVETTDERVAREMEESERLAYEMMREEAQSAYEMQMEFMRANSDTMSAEDFAALQAAIGMDTGIGDMAMINGTDGIQGQYAGNGDEQDEEHDDGSRSNDSVDSNTSGASSGWRDPNNYERLLALGNQIGDVKTERWRLRAQGVIDALPRIKYSEILSISQPAMFAAKSLSSPSSSISSSALSLEGFEREKREVDEKEQDKEHSNDSIASNPRKRLCLRTIDSHCSVCMDPFLVELSGSTSSISGPNPSTGTSSSATALIVLHAEVELPLLPCSHYVHDECLRGWMADNNSCPVCRLEVSPSTSSI